MRGLRSDSQLPRNLFHAVAVDIFPLQRIAVVRRQSVQRHLDQPRHLKSSIVFLRLSCGRRLQRIHGSLQIRRIFRENDGLAVSRQSFEVIVQLMPAYRAQPGEQRSLASVGMQLLNRLRKRDVNNLPGGIQVIAQPRTSKAVQPREIAVEEFMEGLPIMCQEAFYQSLILKPLVHVRRSLPYCSSCIR